MGMVLSLKCGTCGRVVHYWAADLVQALGPLYRISRPPWACRCKASEGAVVKWFVPGPSALQGLTVRRPVKKIEKWVWRDERA